MFYKCCDYDCGWDGIWHDAVDRLCPVCEKTLFHYNKFCTAWYLQRHPDDIFVFGDNLIRKGKGGAAKLRDEPNAYGFITKKRPDNNDTSFYTPMEYRTVFNTELEKLEKFVIRSMDKRFLISKLGAGLADKYSIWEIIIEYALGFFINAHKNVYQLWL